VPERNDVTHSLEEIRLTHVLTGQVQRREDAAGSWESAVEKRPLSGSAQFTKQGIVGDQQADRRHHGGPDKAVLAWSAAHYPRWEAWLGRALAPGSFGENLLLTGLDEESVCLGDRWALCPVAEARDEDPPVESPVLEVSQPRQPCFKPGRLLGHPDLMHRMLEQGHTGWYLRVLVGGWAGAGSHLLLLQRPHPDWTISRCWRAHLSRDTHPQEWNELRRLPELAEAWRG
jgi:MOSC domain-containing protein YiiM